jgi:anti-sigma regulatory factor (Ser/Thr protein kinase)
VRAFLGKHDVEHDVAWDIVTCIHEGCANAILHSGSPDDIDVRLTVDEESVTILVTDSGRGLELNRYDPHRQPELLRSDGRGLYTMACLMDEFEIGVDGGTEIRMTKRLPSPRA